MKKKEAQAELYNPAGFYAGTISAAWIEEDLKTKNWIDGHLKTKKVLDNDNKNTIDKDDNKS